MNWFPKIDNVRDKEMRMEYEAREKAIRDHEQMMWESREAGIMEGRIEGIEIGKKEQAMYTIKKLIALGYETEIISQVTYFPPDEIDALR